MTRIMTGANVYMAFGDGGNGIPLYWNGQVDEVFKSDGTPNVSAITYDSSNSKYTGNFVSVGAGVKITSFKSDPKTELVYSVGNRIYDVAYSKGFEGSLSFEIYFSTMNEAFVDFLKKYINVNDVDMIKPTNLYIFTIDSDITQFPNSGSKEINSLPVVEILKFVADNIKITSKTEEAITVSIDGKFSAVAYYDSVDATINTENMFNVVDTFANATVSIGSGLWNSANYDFSLVKNFELNIKNNFEALYSLGQAYPKGFREQKYEVELSFDTFMPTDTFKQVMKDFAMKVESGGSGADSFMNNFNKSGYYPDVGISFSVNDNSGTGHSFTVNDGVIESLEFEFEDVNIVEFKGKLKCRSVELS